MDGAPDHPLIARFIVFIADDEDKNSYNYLDSGPVNWVSSCFIGFVTRAISRTGCAPR
jgi:hypothetical protein